MPKVAHRLVLIRTYVRTYVASLAVSLLPEREWPEREREWERASLSSSMMTTHHHHHHRTYLDVSGQAIWCCEFDAPPVLTAC